MPTNEQMMTAPPKRAKRQYEKSWAKGLVAGLLAKNYESAHYDDDFYFAGYLRGKRIRLGTPVFRAYKNTARYLKRACTEETQGG